jgi:hypothetical protein
MIDAWNWADGGLDWGVQTSGVTFSFTFFFQDRNFDTLRGMSGVILFLLQLHTFF